MNSGYTGDALFPIGIFCAECGDILQERRGAAVTNVVQERIDGLARHRYDKAVTIAVTPRKTCMEKHTAPAIALATAIKGLIK